MQDIISQAFCHELDKLGMSWFRRKAPAPTVDVNKGVPLELPAKTVATVNRVHGQAKKDYDAKNLRLDEKMKKMEALTARARRLREGPKIVKGTVTRNE
jgi:hypothetical protein